MAKKKNNFYAVKQGKNPGIYKTWDECKAQVEGFSGALYKGFSTRKEAEIYLSGNVAPTKHIFQTRILTDTAVLEITKER